MIRLIYILAASHSGSTLLSLLLAAHRDVCTAGELKMNSLGDIDRYLCSCGQRIRECDFWTQVTERMRRRGLDFDVTHPETDFAAVPSPAVQRLLRPLHRGRTLEFLRDLALALCPAWRTALPRIQAANAALMQTLCEVYGTNVIVDSSKIGLRLKYLLRNPGLDIRVVRLVRDGRAVAATHLDPARYADAGDPALRGGGYGADRRAEQKTMRDAAIEWRRSNEEAEQILARFDPQRWIQVRYENLCCDTQRVRDDLYRFIAVDPAAAAADFRSIPRHVIGNGMRLDRSSEVRLDERWRTVLGPADLAAFEEIAGPMNRRYGYV